jgi:hypothetical protein
MARAATAWGISAALSALALACTERGSLPQLDADLRVDARPDAGDGASCRHDIECADRIACSIDRCVAGECRHDPCVDCCPEGLTCELPLGCVREPEPCTSDGDCRDAIRCTLDACRDRRCEHRPENGLCARGEICLPAVGCIPEPPSSCERADDCRVAACVGEWDCEPEFGCEFVAVVDCDDGDACTDDACVEELGGCVHAPRDVDRDGFGDAACDGGDDCDDADASVHPGATEACSDGIDQDCDRRIDEGCCTPGVCTTACGTSGTIECPAGACVPPPETCNGRDDDCDGVADEGFECVRGGSEACATDCGSSGTRACDEACAWGICTPPAEVCNGRDDDCDGVADEGFACVRGESSACPTLCGSVGTRTCGADCRWDLCAPPPESCNGVDDDCDGACDDGYACCQGSVRDCSALGFFRGTAICRPDCGGFDTSTCSNCGNGRRDAGEQCDGADLGGASCTSIGMGFGGGTLRCAPGCVYDPSGCTRCGNGAIDPGEQCDGSNLGGASCTSIGMGFSGGTLRCSPSCSYDTSACTRWDPSGVYWLTPAPRYMCAYFFGAYLVNFDGSTMTFADGGTLLTVSVTGLPCTMSGGSPRATRSFDVSCTAPGSCTETYRLTGTFSDDDTWSGTFSATYIGGGACLDCTSRSWTVTGRR